MKRLLLVLAFLAAATTSRAADITPAAVERLVQPFVQQRWLMGAVVAVVDGDRVTVRGFGRRSGQDGRAPDADTRFEIASVSKTLAALVTADSGVDLDTPLARYLPSTVHVPSKDGQVITLRQLAQHRSGLPKIPKLVSQVPGDPYHGYTEQLMLDGLADIELDAAPGARYSYSNLGVALLGKVVADRAGKPYPALVAEKIFRPLGMSASSFGADATVVPGHDAELEPTPFWSFGPFNPAGGVISTAADLGRYVAACLDPQSPIAPALRRCQEHTAPAYAGAEVGLAWHHDLATGVWFHDGASGGFRSLVAFHPASRRGLVFLANATCYPLTKDLDAPHNLVTGLLELVVNGSTRVTPPPVFTLAPAALALHAGEYALDADPSFHARVTGEDDHLVIAFGDIFRQRLYSTGAHVFVERTLATQTTFDAPAGAVTGVTYLLEGSPMHFTRVATP